MYECHFQLCDLSRSTRNDLKCNISTTRAPSPQLSKLSPIFVAMNSGKSDSFLLRTSPKKEMSMFSTGTEFSSHPENTGAHNQYWSEWGSFLTRARFSISVLIVLILQSLVDSSVPWSSAHSSYVFLPYHSLIRLPCLNSNRNKHICIYVLHIHKSRLR